MRVLAHVVVAAVLTPLVKGLFSATHHPITWTVAALIAVAATVGVVLIVEVSDC